MYTYIYVWIILCTNGHTYLNDYTALHISDEIKSELFENGSQISTWGNSSRTGTIDPSCSSILSKISPGSFLMDFQRSSAETLELPPLASTLCTKGSLLWIIWASNTFGSNLFLLPTELLGGPWEVLGEASRSHWSVHGGAS